LNARLLRAGAYLSAGKKNEAADDLTHAVRLLSRDDAEDVKSVLESIDGLIEAYAAAGQNDKAINWAEKAVELARDDATKDAFRKRIKELKAKEPAARPKKSDPRQDIDKVTAIVVHS
jgi:lipopolysaccharide biosynthesis regulator YciM